MSGLLLLSLACVFVSVALLTGLATSSYLSRTATGRKRLRDTTDPMQTRALPEILTLAAQSRTPHWPGLAKLLGRNQKEMSRLQMRLMRAGFRGRSAPVAYVLLETLTPILLAVPPLLLMSGTNAWLVAAALALGGFLAPGAVVNQRLTRRRRQIENGLPDALDLIVVCIEAGSGVDQAILRTSEELAIAYPTLADELRVLTTEMRAGKTRIEAFKNLAQRTKVDDVRALVAMLIQTDKFGTSLGQALRTHAQESRTKRRQRAEEKAEKLGVKLVFPLVLCFFPAFFIVVLGPAIIQFVHMFMPE